MNFKISRQRRGVLPAVCLLAFFLLTGAVSLMGPGDARAQELTSEMLQAASRQTGLSEAELLRRYQQGGTAQAQAETTQVDGEPGRKSLEGIDDSRPFRDTDAQVVLPFSESLASEELLAELLNEALADSTGPEFFGEDFFHLDEGVFTPPSFGPVSGDYRLGVGDEIIINVWGGVDLQLTRIVDRDGSIILPRVGKIVCAGRSLDDLEGSIRERLAQSHSSINVDNDSEGETHLEVTLGQLRAIRVFVVGQAVRPGSYELNSVSTVLTALYAAGGPSDQGTFRTIEIVRGGDSVGVFDLYTYLQGGSRAQDIKLYEGDTVFIGDRGVSVQIRGGVRRPMFYEMKADEALADLINYAGGFSATAAPEVIHISRILPPALRQAGQPDQVFLDIPFDATALSAVDGTRTVLLDGDDVLVDDIGDRLENWVEVAGSVKRPGRYEFRRGMTVADLLQAAGGLWPDALTERAVIDRTGADKTYSSLAVPLARVLAGDAEPVALQAMDVVHVFSRWESQIRPQVSITGEVFKPFSTDFREGMTLRDLILKAGGLKEGADWLRAEVARLDIQAVRNPDTMARPAQTTEILRVELGPDFLTREESFQLQPYDRVAIRRLPWWEMQKTVTVQGEVFYPGVFSLERKDERLSSVLERAGGLQPDAYLIGTRIMRSQDGVGNIAIDLEKALAEPGSQYDIILQNGDRIVVPERMFTVKVVGEVGFPTSLVFEDGKNIDYYVDHAGGYLEKSDKGKTRVVYPNGMSLPNKGGNRVVAGSTIIVPVEPPPEGKGTWEYIRDISSIVASLATVWLIVDK